MTSAASPLLSGRSGGTVGFGILPCCTHPRFRVRGIFSGGSSRTPIIPVTPLLSAGWLLFLLALILALPPAGDLLGLLGALMLSVSILALLAGQVTPRTRKALVTTYVVFSGSWLGVGAVMITLSILAATNDVAASHYSYSLLELFDQSCLGPASARSSPG